MANWQSLGEGSSITEHYRAIDLFTDRAALIRRYAAYLNEEPTPGRIVFVHGEGGIGKSLLLRFLRDKCSKRLLADNWEYLKDRPDEEFQSQLAFAQGATDLHPVHHQFGAQPTEYERPQNAFDGLLMLRRALSGRGLAFPLFDFACVWYLRQIGQLSTDSAKKLFPPEEIGFIVALIGLATTAVPLARMVPSVLAVVTKHLGKQFEVYRVSRQLQPETLARLQSFEPRTELLEHLPELFAKDLNASMAMPASPARIVFLFDQHEAFFGGRHDLSPAEERRDEWLRRLLFNLELNRGVVAMVAGREYPGWSAMSRVAIPDSLIEPWPLGYLPAPDADLYLRLSLIHI